MLPVVRQIAVHRIAVPFRRPFAHARAERSGTDSLILQVELAGGEKGVGEAVPRPYVTGESVESALAAIRDVFLPHLADVAPQRFADVLAAVDALPFTGKDAQPLYAARCAVELALLDAYSRHFRQPLEVLVGWLDLPALGGRPSLPGIRYSGVVSAEDPRQVKRSLRKMRLFGLRDFKIKVGLPEDEAILHAVRQVLGRALRGGRATLRADANGAWEDLDLAADRIRLLAETGAQAIEQPLPARLDDALPKLAARIPLPVMADESLVSLSDAERLAGQGGVQVFNLRIAKHGGLIPTLRLAAFAAKHGLACQLGCMVGETGVLSAAGRLFLQWVPAIRYAEGSYGTFLLREDLVAERMRFGYGGRARPITGLGLGVTLDETRLARWRRDHVLLGV